MPQSRRAPTSVHLVWIALFLCLLLAGCDLAGRGGDAGSPDAPAPAPGEDSGDGGGGGSGGQEPSPQPGQLTAGEWRDLDNWDYWLTLMAKPEWSRMQGHWTFYPTARRTVQVTGRGRAVVDAKVTLRNAQGEAHRESRTDVRGNAEVFFNIFSETPGPYSLTVTSGDATQEALTVTAW